MKLISVKGSVDTGLLLLRLTLAYSLLTPALLTIEGFTASLGLYLAIVQIVGLIVFTAGGIFIILGFRTRMATLGILFLLLLIDLSAPGVPYGVSVLALFLALFFTGAGHYSIDARSGPVATSTTPVTL
jgi:uncharacterized membrane protein YphA (DoxX/SURF4 family)